MEPISKINLPGTEVDYIQYLQYEVNAYKLILSDVLIKKDPKYEYSKENYEHFMNEFKEATFKLDLYINDLIERYAPEFSNKSEYNFDISFTEGTLNFYKKGYNVSCKCGGGK